MDEPRSIRPLPHHRVRDFEVREPRDEFPLRAVQTPNFVLFERAHCEFPDAPANLLFYPQTRESPAQCRAPELLLAVFALLGARPPHRKGAFSNTYRGSRARPGFL